MIGFFEYVNSHSNAYFGIQLPNHVIIISIIIALLFISFLFFYFFPALLLLFKLWRLKIDLKFFKKRNLLEYPTQLFNRGRIFNHLWAEYQKTLHEQYRLNPKTNAQELITIRSTAPAEVFFGPNVLVDSQLHTEFFKHLPGIFTGIGIIGTFLGLINGLQAFQIDENTEIVRQSLNQLLHGVREAFYVSMAAILLAMVVTLIEKWLLSKLYRKVEDLCFLIDSCYESGAGEEYLERLVKSSEASASQANIIKDALVGELKEILREITQQQIQSTLNSQQQLGEQFKESIHVGISQPLQKIAAGFDDQRESNGRDLSSALNDVFVGFTQRLQDLFGGQTAGIYELQQQTVEALQATVKQFQQMTTNIDSTGRNTTNAMTETLAQAMKAMEFRQQAMNEQMADFLVQVRTTSQASQNETGQKLQTLLGNLGQQMTKMVAELQTQARAANDDHQGRQQQLAEATITAIANLSNGVQTSLQTMQGQLTSMLEHLDQQTHSTAAQNTEQQRQLAEQNQRAVQALTSSVDQTVSKVSEQTADMLAKLAGTVESQQATIADVVTRMVAELQTQSRAANDDHQGRQQQLAEATITAIANLSNGVQTSLQTMQGQLTGMLNHLDQQTHSTAAQNTEQQRQLAEQNQRAVQALTSSVDQTVSKVSTQTADMLAKLAGTVESQQATIADVVTRMVAELQAQSRLANDDHQGRQQQMADATIAAIAALSGGVQSSLQTMQGQLTGMLDHLEQQTHSTAAHQQEQQRQLTVHNQQAVSALTASVNETVDKVSTETAAMLAKLTGLVESHQLAAAEAVRSIQAAINQMSEVTTSALSGMNQGAENLIIATDDFSKAGQSVAGVLHEATGVATKLSLSADAVSISTRAMETIVGDYSTVRQQLNDMVQALKGTVESARKEASLTADVLTRIDHATQKLATAQNQADRYLAQVSEVLEETHQQFASSMRSTLNEANQQFFQHLTDATALLRGSIEELDAALGNVSTRK